jgi:hypothetical protein
MSQQSQSHRESIDLFRRGPEILEAAIAGVSKEESIFAPFPGKWTIREIVRHLTDTELVVGMRLRQMIAEERPLMALFDQDLWAHRLHYNQCDPFDSATKFRVMRDDISSILEHLPPEMFDRVGLHPERGAGTLGEWVTRFGAHVEKHAGQIRQIREAWARR